MYYNKKGESKSNDVSKHLDKINSNLNSIDIRRKKRIGYIFTGGVKKDK